jgi:hypothetical protein
MIAEHPILASVREYLKESRTISPSTIDSTNLFCFAKPTPVIVLNAPRQLNIVGLEHLYGHKFATASNKQVLDNVVKLDYSKFPPLSNIIAMTAPTLGPGTYTFQELEYLLVVTCSAFIAAKKIKNLYEYSKTSGFTSKKSEPQGKSIAQIVIHSGNWGCGPCGGNKIVSFLIQMIAANVSGIHKLVLHSHANEEFNNALKMYQLLGRCGRMETNTMLSLICKLGLEHRVSTLGDTLSTAS